MSLDYSCKFIGLEPWFANVPISRGQECFFDKERRYNLTDVKEIIILKPSADE